jgi:Na+-driven multidrug efflux pump
MAWVLSYFMGKDSLLHLRLNRMKLQAKAVLQILSIGVSPFSMQIATSLVAILANRTLRIYGGDAAIGVMTIITSMAILCTMPIFGLNQGMQPILGYNYGAKNYARVSETLRYGVIIATGIVLAGTVLIQGFPRCDGHRYPDHS